MHLAPFTTLHLLLLACISAILQAFKDTIKITFFIPGSGYLLELQKPVN